jgi:hypothetical protein
LDAERGGLPIEVVKRFTKGILNGLGFLHEELGLIYAGPSPLAIHDGSNQSTYGIEVEY